MLESRAMASASVLALAGLMGGSLAMAVGGVAAHLWTDEGIAVGLAGHPLSQIPHVLRLDGSPPLYYLLLHLWIGVAGDSDAAVHWLSLAFAVLCVPAAWWCGAGVGDRRTAWILAALAAACPYLRQHAAEARMYSLVVLLGLLCVGCFARAYMNGRKRYRAAFGVTLALLLYTHTWGLLVAAALALAVVPLARRREVVRDALIGFGIAAALYAPWLPTLLFQARHTGAPWATSPPLSALVTAPETALGGAAATLIVALAVVAALATRRAREASLLIAAAVPLLLAWGLSQRSPAWDARYVGVIVAPALALVAAGLSRARGAGLVALLALVLLMATATPPRERSDAFTLARAAAPHLRRDDLVVVTPFAQLPLVAHYLPPGLRYASTLGAAPDPHVADWRDVTRRLARASMRRTLLPLLARAPVGSHVLLVLPEAWDARSHRTRLGAAERRASREAEDALLHEPSFARVATFPAVLPHMPRSATLRGVLLRKIG
jgi:mannosyltransferase